MRVLILAQYYPPDMGGGATRAYNAAKGLLSVGCSVTVVAAFPHYPTGKIPEKYRWKPLRIESKEKLRVIRTFVPPLASEGLAKRVLLFASFIVSSLFALPFTGKVDIIWTANPNILGVFPSLIYKVANRCKIVQNVDDLWPEALYDLGLDPKSLLARFGEFVARIAYKVSSGITPISPAYVDVLLRKYGVDQKKIFVVLAGVDANKFHLRRKNVKRERFRVLYIGAFSPAYDFDQVFKAAESLTLKKVDFIIQGGGELAYELRRKQKENALANVEVIENIVSRDEVIEIMAEADALLLPLNGVGSIEKGISSKLYEYQAAEKPIICCSNGQPGRYVTESRSGLVVKPGDFQMLAESILCLMENPSFARELGSSGRRYVLDNLTIKQTGVAIMQAFNKIWTN